MVTKEFPDEGELVLCTVMKIMGTTIFTNIENYNKTGIISTSEIAPGRIRNIRDYVTINKKIACKVLRIDRERGNIDLSLRRVSQKDSREILEAFKKENAALLILKMVLNEKANQIADKIRAKSSIMEFLEKARENPALLDEFFPKKEAEQILKIIKEKIKEKKFEAKAVISISSTAPNGITLIKEALLSVKTPKITYIGAPNYSISVESINPKEVDKKLQEAIETISKKIKASGGKIEVKEED